MSDQPDPRGTEKETEDGGTPADVSKPHGRQKVGDSAVQAYKAAKRLAKHLQETAGRLTTSEWITAIFTAVIAGATIWNVEVVRSSLSIMQGQLNEMRTEQRPWVYANVVPDGPIFQNQSGGLTLQLAFIFHNVGHLPAFYVAPYLATYLSGEKGVIGSSVVTQRQKEICSKPAPPVAARLGTTVFPGQTIAYGVSAGITRTEISSVPQPAGLNFLSPWVAGCIRYWTPNGSEHQSGFAFMLDMTKPGQPGEFALPADPTKVPTSQLHVSTWIAGGNWYAK